MNIRMVSFQIRRIYYYHHHHRVFVYRFTGSNYTPRFPFFAIFYLE